MSKITDKVTALAKPIVEEEGCSLWDVEYVREAGSWYLRVFIDKEGGVSIDDCERISRRLDPILDGARSVLVNGMLRGSEFAFYGVMRLLG